MPENEVIEALEFNGEASAALTDESCLVALNTVAEYKRIEEEVLVAELDGVAVLNDKLGVIRYDIAVKSVSVKIFSLASQSRRRRVYHQVAEKCTLMRDDIQLQWS